MSALGYAGRRAAGLATLKYKLLALLIAVLSVLGVAGLLGLTAIQSGSQNDSACPGAAPALGVGGGAIQWPMVEGSYRLTSGYGPRWGSFHRGIDLAAPIGTPIYSAADGVVREAGKASGFGLWAVVDHTMPDGSIVSTVYGHNNRNLVTAGQVVRAGQPIAEVGNRGESTGPHLHFEVWLGGRFGGTSTDPTPWLNANASPGSGGITVQSVSQAQPNAPPVDDALPGGAADLVGQVPPQGQQATMSIDAEQQSVVDAVVGVVKGRGLPLRTAVLTVAAGAQESGLRNLTYGDRDSEGFLQQRPSQGWGTPEQVRDPVYATGKFLDGLLRVPNWEAMPLTLAVDAVQRSAFPQAYAKWEQLATELVAAAAGVAPVGAGMACGPGGLVAGGQTAAGPVVPVGLVTRTTGWAIEPQNVPDPTGTGGLVTQRTADGVAAVRAAGYGGTGISCWDEHAWNPASDHPRGRGCDVMFTPYPAATPQGWAAANWLVANQAALGIKYLIFDGLYWSATNPGQWTTYQSRVYGCPNPAEVTGCHYDHIHISYY